MLICIGILTSWKKKRKETAWMKKGMKLDGWVWSEDSLKLIMYTQAKAHTHIRILLPWSPKTKDRQKTKRPKTKRPENRQQRYQRKQSRLRRRKVWRSSIEKDQECIWIRYPGDDFVSSSLPDIHHTSDSHLAHQALRSGSWVSSNKLEWIGDGDGLSGGLGGAWTLRLAKVI